MCTGMTSYHRPDGWISVRDRLPDTARNVIACSDSGTVFECWYYEKAKAWGRCGFGLGLAENITHWRELPDPPRMEEKE